MMSKNLVSRGLHMLVTRPQQLRMIQQGYVINQNAIINAQMRSFAKKGTKKTKKGSAGTTTDEEVVADEPAAEEPVVAKAAPAPPKAAPAATQSKDAFNAAAGQVGEKQSIDKALFSAFTVGDMKQIQSTEDNKAPFVDDSVPGRYAQVLFTTASQQEALFTIYEDVAYIQSLYKNCESFKEFTQNGGVGAKEMSQMSAALNSIADFNPLTIKFLEILAENGRLGEISQVADKYAKLYKTLNKEEKITIISADELSADEKSEVMAALKANPNNEGKEFTLEYTLDSTIRGGLQMYTETEFMDMSLASRIDRLKSDIHRLAE